MQEEHYILFENYLSGDMPSSEISAFENRLHSDVEFNKTFTTYKELSHFLEYEQGNKQEAEVFKTNLKQISSTYFEDKTQTKKVPQFSIYKYVIAASVALLIGFFISNQFSSPSYNDYAKHDAISFTIRGQQDNIKTKAEHAFNTKNYKEAVSIFKVILDKEPTNLEAEYYKSIALIETEQYSEADNLLHKLSKTNSVFKNKATWYLALSKLKQKENEACLSILKTLPEDADDYKQAQQLIKKLD